MEIEKYFYKGGLNCAESTLRALIEEGHVDLPIDAVKMMSGFGGGMQRGATCGAVVGAVCAIGSKLGRTETDEDRTPSADAVREFLKAFEEKFGALNCKELLALHAKDEERKSDGQYRKCTPFVEFAAEYVAGMK